MRTSQFSYSYFAAYCLFLASSLCGPALAQRDSEDPEAAYRAAIKANTQQALERLVYNYDIKLTKQQRHDIFSRLRSLLYDRALNSGTRADWHDFIARYYFQPDNLEPVVSQMLAKAKLEEERLLAQDIRQAATLELCEQYLRDYPKGKNTSTVLMSYEPLLATALEKATDLSAFERYTKLFPNGAHAKQVEQLMFAAASAADWYSDWEKYIEAFPDGANVQKAQERLAFLKANKADVVSEFPATVQGNGHWAWKTVFKETGGKIGFRITGGGAIIDKKGHRWASLGKSFIMRGQLTVKAGGSASDDYWCDGAFLGGHADFAWTGEDAGGHRINIDVKVDLR